MANGDKPCEEKAKWTYRPLIASFVLGGSFGLFALCYFRPISTEWKEVVMLIVGALIANMTTVVNWYFGSSEDSSRKTEALIKTTNTG